MVEFGDFLYKISPLILGALAFFVLPATERVKLKKQAPLEVTKGKVVSFDDREDDRAQEREISRLRILCAEHGIEWRTPAMLKEEREQSND